MSNMTIPPGFTGEAYPKVFTVPPPQPKEKKPGHLSKEQLNEFFDKGFVIVKNFFKQDELEPCRDACNDLVEDIAQKLYKAGKIKDLYKEYGFKNRLIKIDKEWPGAVILLVKLGKLPKAFRDLWANEKLLNAVEQLVGPEIAANPVWNLRPKAPRHEGTLVPWHQDSAYFDNDSYGTMVASAWIPFVDATEENGCLEMLVGGHRKGLICEHKCCEDLYLMIDEEAAERRLVKYKNYLKRNIPNVTDYVRWSIDLRWQSSERPWGFYGLKPGVPMRSAKNLDLKVNWEEYDSVDRYKVLKKYNMDKIGDTDQSHLEDEFDTTITGPHLEKYEIVKHTRHVEAYYKRKADEKKSG